MAMEIKTLEVKNSEEQSTIEFWAQFGWQLKSSQRIYNKDSHLERRGDNVVSVTETVDFTKIVLERDKSGPNYEKIAALEKEYFSLKASLPAVKPTLDKTYESLEEWAKATKPDVRNKGQKTAFLVMLIGGIALVALLEIFNSPVTMAIQALGIVSIVLSFITKSKFKKSMLNKTLEGNNPEGMEVLKKGYEEYNKAQAKNLERVNDYLYSVKRMNGIIDELKELI